MSELTPEMSLLLEKLTERLQDQTKTIKESITELILNRVEEKINPIIEENAKLKNEVEILNKRMESLELSHRRNNIIIHGLPENTEENHEKLTSLILTTLEDIDVGITKGDINRIQRLGKKGQTDKIRPILLATTTLDKKIQILSNKKKMKKDTYITHDLPKQTLQKNKDKKSNRGRENEKRKRSETPSPRNIEKSPKNDPKLKKTDAFQYLRERQYALSEKNTYLNN